MMRLSLRYGGGDVRWAEKLPVADLVEVLAYEHAEQLDAAHAAAVARASR